MGTFLGPNTPKKKEVVGFQGGERQRLGKEQLDQSQSDKAMDT